MSLAEAVAAPRVHHQALPDVLFYEEAGLLLLEAHVLDFDGDLYEQPSRVRFHYRLRAQERFESADALVAQMREDVARTRGLMG